MKIKKRVLIIDNVIDNNLAIEDLKQKFDDVIDIHDYIRPLSEVDQVINTYGRLPVSLYSSTVNARSPKPLNLKAINKVMYVRIKPLDLGENTAYFVSGKLSWYFLRDFNDQHVGLRNTNLDWQIIHLEPFSMGTNKFVFCHSMLDERFKKHKSYFFDDAVMGEEVKPLPSSKVLCTLPEIKKALLWATEEEEGSRFGLDYETNGLWRNHKYEDLMAIGVGISTKEVGFYIELRDLNPEELTEFKVYYKDFLDKHEKNIWVFNLDFEMIVTRKLLGNWATYEFKDADIWRVMYGDQIGYSIKKKSVKPRFGSKDTPLVELEKVNRDQRWSLKYTAQKYLKVPSWDNEFEHVEKALTSIFDGYKIDNIDGLLTNPIIGPKIHSMVSSGDITSLEMTRILKRLINYKKINTEEDIETAFNGKVDYDKAAFSKALLGTSVYSEVISHPVWKTLIAKYPSYEKEFLKYIKDPRFIGNPYAVQPSNIVGEYCILDSYYTVMIAETQYEKDFFTPKGGRKVDADWASTDKLVNIFNANKSLGAMLNMHGLYKSNTKRDKYNNIQERVRVYSNYILAKGFNNLLLHKTNLKPHPNEASLNRISLECIRRDLDPTDFNKVTKTLFKEVYDSTQPYKWSDKKAEDIFGPELAQSFKDIVLDYSNNVGFKNPSAYSRSINMHKECGALVEDAWEELELGADFDWTLCKDYYRKSGSLIKAKNTLALLDTFNIKGMSIDEVLEVDIVSYKDELGNLVELSFPEAVTVLKKEFFDVATANEVKLGVLFEKWKSMRILFAMYSPKEHKDVIDGADIFLKSDTVETKVDKFDAFVNNLLDTYEGPTPTLNRWEDARRFAKANKFPEDLCNPNLEDMKDVLQQSAYINSVISQDIYNEYKVTLKFVTDYKFFNSISAKMMTEEKEWMLRFKNSSPLSYRDSVLDKGAMCSTYDTLLSGGFDTSETEDKLKICDISDTVDYSYYPILATCFKLYRKYDKLGQYLNGQLVDSDYRVEGEDSDGVPKISHLTKVERHQGVAGDQVKMFPRYEIMQKSTKRNSSGIHTVPSSSEVKGIIVAPEDSLLVYTDISSMELRGIAAVANDQVMIDYFNSGKDIYTEAAMAYHVDFLKKDMTYAEVRALYRNPYKIGVISTIYTASDRTLAKSFGVEVFEVREIKNAIFNKFVRLYEWQQEQVSYNKANRGTIKTYLGDIRKTYDKAAKQSRQAVNMDIQGTCSLVATAGFCNIVTEARKKKMYLPPAVIVHDAIVAYAKAKDIEELYDHYQKSFYDFLENNYGFQFPFDLEIAANYFEKTVLEKGDNPREFSISGTNRAIKQVLERSIQHGKKIEFLDPAVSLTTITDSIDSNYSILDQYIKAKGNASFNRDFSYAKYKFKFID